MLNQGPYDPVASEPNILKYWLENKFFKPEYHRDKGLQSEEEMKADGRETFSIVNPPPNAYMRPHIGNVSGYAYQDAFLRYNRLLGKKVFGQPGKDHAGIQGEVVLEKIFWENKKKTKQDMGREKFYKASYAHFEKLMPMIMADEQRIGLSSDYERNLFTLDPRVVDTVLGTFIKMYQDKMVYKGVRIVNWDPVAKTTLADIDTLRLKRETELVYIKYPFNENDNKAIKLRAEYAGKDIKFIFERNQTTDKKFKLPFSFGHVGETDVIGIGYLDNIQSGEHLTGKVVGIQLRNDNNYRLVVVSNDFNASKIDSELEKIFDFEKQYYSGATIVLFDRIRSDDELKNGIITATTRPESMLGDTAIVVHPDDERYQGLIGKKVIIPLANREIPIITSPRIEKEFGTGALKLTPSHAYDDYVIMNEWNIANPDKQVGYINVIDKQAKMCGPIPDKYKGMTTEEAKKTIIQDLGEFLIKKEKYEQNVVVGERSKAVIEPIMSSQWFIDVEKLKQPAIEAVKNGEVKIHPDYMSKKYLNWMQNLHDWPVSRSLWWGYRIPVWYKGEIKESIDDNGQVVETINGEIINDIYDAVKKGLAKVQVNAPGQVVDTVRHGETMTNKSGIYAGITDPDLNETGKQQALDFADKLNSSDYDLIIHSPLKRSKQTAEIIAQKTGVVLLEEPLTIERNLGVLEGLTWEQFSQKYPELLQDNSEQLQANLPGGESIGEVEARVGKFIEKIKTEYKDKKILVVTHGGVIRILKRLLGGQTTEESRKNDPDNLDMNKFTIVEDDWIQDDDVFDTWFSSGQWAYATLDANKLMDTFYPSTVMETAYDILELWVSRMIMLGIYTQGQIPFEHVYLHGLVKAPDGQKMSKSKGNVIAPEEIITKYGADSLRLLYIVGNKAGAGYPVSYEKLEGHKRFLNKIWNASKLVLNTIQDFDDKELKNWQFEELEKISSNPQDQKILAELKELVVNVGTHLDKFRLGLAAELLYQHFWHTFCDVYLEEVKPRTYIKDREGNPINLDEAGKRSRQEAQKTLYIALKTYMILLHPIIPFITETIWQALPKLAGESETIMYAKWPRK